MVRIPVAPLVPFERATSAQKFGYFLVGLRDLLRERATPEAPAAQALRAQTQRTGLKVLEMPLAFLVTGLLLVLVVKGVGAAAHSGAIPGQALSTLALGLAYGTTAGCIGGLAYWGVRRMASLRRAYLAVARRGYDLRNGVRAPWGSR